MNWRLFSLPLLLVFLFSCQTQNNKVVMIENTSGLELRDELVKIDLATFDNFEGQSISVFLENNELPSQLVDNDNDDEMDQIHFLVDLKKNEAKKIKFKNTDTKTEFKKRVHAEISEKIDYTMDGDVYTGGKFKSVKVSKTPPGHRDHNYFYKCEGPAWESDKVGYRLYFDARNATDIFGKKTSDIVLPSVGHDKDSEGQDTYHTMADWGMDILKVGNSLGIGSFAAWVDGKVEKVSKTDSSICIISADGPIYADLNIKYFGWDFGPDKIDLESRFSISAGSRLTKYILNITSTHKEFCTGIVKHENTEFLKSDMEKDWNYIALWGKQSLAGDDDELGIVLFYNKNQLIKITEDENSHLLVLTPENNEISYYFAACWVQEPGGIKNINEFKEYLNESLAKLNNPILVN